MSLKEHLEKVENVWKVKKGTPLESACILTLHQAWGTDPNGYFPGPQPTSIERKHFPLLKNHYYICEKTDGVRHVLVAFMFGPSKVCVLIDRSFSCTLVQNSLPKSAYKTTVLDGELIGTNFVVYDSIFISGCDSKYDSLTERLFDAKTFIIDDILKLKTDIFTITVKTMYSLKHDRKLFMEYYKSLTETDGVILTPHNEPIRTGTHDTLFKWKPRDQNTIDFLMKKTGNKWSMYVQEKGSLIFESELPLCDAPSWLFENCIAECQYMHQTQPRWWKPLKLRADKSHPNNRRTFYRTLNNIKEDIQLSELK